MGRCVLPAERDSRRSGTGFDLLRRQPIEDNVVFSPASIGHACLMAAAAADDATRIAIEEAFGVPADAHDAWNSIDQTTAAAHSDQVTVAIADRIWPTVGLQPGFDLTGRQPLRGE
jgi:serine protease inhibitor